MGFLHKLWDETLAGPAPDDGLGQIRGYNYFSATRSSTTTTNPDHDEITSTPISRSITVLRSNSTNLRNLNINANANANAGSSSVPSSPSSGSITPAGSPFSPSALRAKKLARRKSTAEAIQCEESRSPTGYDWIVLSALDR